MPFYLSRCINASFGTVLQNLKDRLHEKEYLVASEIDVQSALKQRLDADLPQISIIGTNTPKVGYTLFSHDPRLGTLLPFSIVLHEISQTEIEVTMIDPQWLFQSIDNTEIQELVEQVKLTFTEILDQL